MLNWIDRMQQKRKENQRRKLLSLIGRDIEDIARDAYNDGCWITEKKMRAERQLEFAHLTKENKKLRELLAERTAITMPDFITGENR